QIEKELPIYMTVWMNFTPLAAQEKTRYHVICIKSRCNLHEMTVCFDADSAVFCVKLQRVMHQKPKQEH
ncbi:MAG: hypothetical protein ACFNYJ_02565, partial [Segatella oris]